MPERPKILIIDDEESIRNFLLDALSEQYDVSTAEDGEAGLKELNRGDFDAALVDLKMPKIDGISVLREIKQQDYVTEVIMLTAYASVDTAVEAVRLGAYDYLTKPSKPSDIRRIIRNAIEKVRLERENSSLLLSLKEKNKQLQQHIDHIEKLNQMLERINKENTDMADRLRLSNNDLEKQIDSAALELNRANRSLRENYMATIRALASAIEMKDTYTRGHSSRVTDLSISIAREYGVSDDRILLINYASILHDIGKIGIDESILTKNSGLSPEEFNIIKLHPQMGDKIIQSIEFLQPVRSIVRNHHERMDGEGYIDGLGGEDIPIEARIVSVADAYDAMTSHRAYRNNLTVSQALDQIKENSGTQFDPRIVDIFLGIIEKIGV
jgi:putative two-component system response regulator